MFNKQKKNKALLLEKTIFEALKFNTMISYI